MKNQVKIPTNDNHLKNIKKPLVKTSIDINQDLLSEVDQRRTQLSSLGTILSRGEFFGLAVRDYLDKIGPGIDLSITKQSSVDDLVIIFTARKSLGTYIPFAQNNSKFIWNSHYLNQSRVDAINQGRLKYLAIYLTQPDCLIEKFCEITGIQRSTTNSLKWAFQLENIQSLNTPVTLGKHVLGRSLSKGRLTTLSELQKATTLDDLTFIKEV